MISFERLHISEAPWHELDQFKDRSVFQTQGWVNFVTETQNAEPVITVIRDEGKILGYFTGLITKKLGIKILGSPFSGWTTTYMGFNLLPAADLQAVLEALSKFAFEELGCRVIQLSERRLTDEDLTNCSYSIINYRNLEVDLTNNEDSIFSNMALAKRRGIKKAAKLGVIVEEATADGFAKEYYTQLTDVFAKQMLRPTYDIERVNVLIKHLYPDGKLLLLRARSPDGLSIASAIFPGFNNMMIFWGGASWRKYQKYHPNEYLMWHAIKYWKAKGIKTFNLGGWADYKIQYGGEKINGVILLKSKPGFLVTQHQNAKKLHKFYRKVLGRISC